jgi:antirestriction protein ArdC
MALIRRLYTPTATASTPATPAPVATPLPEKTEPPAPRQPAARGRAKTTKDAAPRDLYQEVTDSIMESIENGTAPWQRPWDGSVLWPTNPTSGKPYHGINVLLLAAEGFQDGRWCTYQQAKGKDWQVRKGERGTRIYFYKPFQKKTGEIDLETGAPEVKVIPILKSYTVFNLAQIDNVPDADPDRAAKHTRDVSDLTVQLCEEIVEAAGVDVVHGYRQACYSPREDKIYMPDRESFASDGAYYATLLHEIGHWTGHESRLNREFGFDRKAPAYAREELRAEMASVMLSMRLGLPSTIDNHSAYVDGYLKLLRGDKKEIFRAAKDAEKLSRYVLSFHPDFRDELESEHRDQMTAAVQAGGPEEIFDASDFDFEPDMPLMGMRP